MNPGQAVNKACQPVHQPVDGRLAFRLRAASGQNAWLLCA